jgi:hypothetical protein
MKKVGSTYTRILDNTNVVIVSDAWLEARVDGTTLQVYYNDAQIGSDITVSDAELLSGKCHGMFSSGDNKFKSFFLGNLISMSQTFAGSSFTYGDGYRKKSTSWELLNYPNYDFDFTNMAIGGHNTWSNLVRLQTGDDLFIIDHANDNSRDMDFASMESIWRLLWEENPHARIVLIQSPSWVLRDIDDDDNVDNPINGAVMNDYVTLANHYGVSVVRYWDWCIEVVDAGTYHLNELTADTVHPTELGYTNMAELLEAHLPNGGGQKPDTLPSRLYDSEDYENTPTRTLGTDYDSKTGSWTETGTQASSSEADATITFSATCQSYGFYRADGTANPAALVSIDGGDFAAYTPSQNGTPIAAGRAAHTIIVKVVSGTVEIDEFWAV